MLWSSGSGSVGECRIVGVVAAVAADLILLNIKGCTAESIRRKGKGGCGRVQCLAAEEETEVLEIQTWILHVFA